ncbi:urotensin-2 [Ambystoma mexicanum]|uniref:urotensin-2 n=1 Tax=Ambystoma mexicanum TaxID=8296 RepID=UPI0037E97112
MNHLVVSCLVLISISGPLFSLPIERVGEVPYSFPESRADLEDVNSVDRTYLLQNLPAFLDKNNFEAMAEDIMIKEDAIPIGYNPSDSVKETFYGQHPRNSLLSRLLSKDKKQYKKRGNLSECFWKYCV